jgi:hypothetical protein
MRAFLFASATAATFLPRLSIRRLSGYRLGRAGARGVGASSARR